MARKRSLSKLELMPIFSQIQIILFVAKDSIEAFHNALMAFPGLGTAVRNPLAHYLRGMQEYFQNENIPAGLALLQIAAQGSYDNAIYLYGIIMLCRGDPDIGKPLLDSLGWRENKARSDACWQSIKTSLHGVMVKSEGNSRVFLFLHSTLVSSNLIAMATPISSSTIRSRRRRFSEVDYSFGENYRSRSKVPFASFDSLRRCSDHRK
ncbi:hypothetical protein YC2023_086002 [Brassica napus]